MATDMKAPSETAPDTEITRPEIAPEAAAPNVVERLRCVDVFSGTGGLSLALHDVTNVIQYCEVHPFCQQVLVERMEDGSLDCASIHNDIRTLHVPPIVEPEIIIGGFPCQDISSIGLRKGIAQGKRSSLFYEIMRIADECPTVKVLFLENVSNIVKCGLKEVVEECTKRGFNLQWTVLSAGDQGAPHLRRRWFCLAVRGGQFDTARIEAALDNPSEVPNWDKEPEQRITFRPAYRDDPTYDPNWSMRSQCLGNAVVPAVARRAFGELMQMHKNWASMAACLSSYGVPAVELTYPYPDAGLIFDKQFFALPRTMKSLKGTKQVQLPKRVSIHLDCGDGEARRLESYPTPRRGVTHASTLTPRSMHDLPSVLIHCLESRKYVQDNHPAILEQVPADKMHTVAYANINYVEWMMGYTKDWTKISASRLDKPEDDSAGDNATAVRGDDEEGAGGSEDEAPARAARPTRFSLRAARGTGRAAASRRKEFRPRKINLNGMHVMMRDHPGKDVRTVANMWKNLTDEERAAYTAKARDSLAAKQDAEAGLTDAPGNEDIQQEA
jgi:DNA (cytosine-5)-methyltransferase 1